MKPASEIRTLDRDMICTALVVHGILLHLFVRHDEALDMAHWARYRHQGRAGFGILAEQLLEEHTGDMFSGATPTGCTLPVGDVELMTPTVPTKMVALANNYHALIGKLGLSVPEEPLYLLKANSAFHPAGKPIQRPPAYAGKVIFEGELGLVIGRECRAVTVDDAHEYLFGCTCVNDVTAIELLNKDPAFQQWVRSKAWDTFGVFGPVVATGLDPASLTVRAVLDGQERQNYPVSDMVFTPYELISRISHDMTLLPGDVIACGTSVGVGSMKPGATIEIAIEGVGSLVNTFDPD